MTAFFYCVGVIFWWAAIGLLAVALVSCVARPPFADSIIPVRSILLVVFLFAATLMLSAYVAEAVIALAGSNPYEHFAFVHTRTSGSYAWAFWLQYLCVLLPQLLWLPSLRRPVPTALIVTASLLPTVLHHVA